MKNYLLASLLPLCLVPLVTECVGTTGSGLVQFKAVASGPSDASGAPGTMHAYTFVSPYTGYTITLSQATLQIGAVYLDASPCLGGSGIPPCVDQAASTVAQVNGGVIGDYGIPKVGVLVDVLSPDSQPFASEGSGLVQQAQSAEVWLMTNPKGEEDAIDDAMIAPTIAQVAGVAVKNGASYTFTATVTIGSNRAIPVSNPALPGQRPICDQRIVRPICLAPPLLPKVGTALHVTVDPKNWFDNIEFSRLGPAGGFYAINDSNDDVTGKNFFQGLESSLGVYSFTFEPP